jgi:hypothetical protein
MHVDVTCTPLAALWHCMHAHSACVHASRSLGSAARMYWLLQHAVPAGARRLQSGDVPMSSLDPTIPKKPGDKLDKERLKALGMGAFA